MPKNTVTGLEIVLKIDGKTYGVSELSNEKRSLIIDILGPEVDIIHLNGYDIKDKINLKTYPE